MEGEMMFERANGETKPHPEWRILVREYCDAPYGAIIPHAEIERFTRVSRIGDHARYFGMVMKFKRALRREHGRLVVSEKAIGYRIVEPDECTGVTRNTFKGASRRVTVAMEQAAATPLELLDDWQVSKHARMLANLGNAAMAVRRALRNTQPSRLAKRPDVPKIGPGTEKEPEKK